MRKFRFHAKALAETDKAAAYYNEKYAGLEQRFLDALEDALTHIQRRPLMYRLVENNIRKCRIPCFPYGIIYRLHDEHIEVIAVMHLRKEPEYWQQRL